MTADIRTAAQREAESRFRYRFLPDNEMRNKRAGFVEGAVWGAARVTPTREVLASLFREHNYLKFGACSCGADYVSHHAGHNSHAAHLAGVVAVALAGLAEGESQ